MWSKADALTEFCRSPSSGPRGGFENDIVFVHGLRGDSHQTWTSTNPDNPDNLPWPQLFLAADLEWTPSRMLTFGYDAKIWHPTKRVSQGTIRHHARHLMENLDRERTSCSERPLIFVAHSLGGLIVKEMLMLTYNYGEACKRIASSTRAILFFGTPHRGSYYADKGAFAATRLSTFGRISNKMLLKQLRPTSDVIESLETDFSLLLRTREAANHSIEICCFFEMKHMGIMKQLVVDKRSAIMDGFRDVGINFDHSGIVKFSSREGEYSRFLHELRKSLPILRTAVHRVILQDNAQAMESLLQTSFDINKTIIHDDIGPAACVAATLGKVEVLKVLAGHDNVDIDRPDDYWKQTPLFRAVKSDEGDGRHLEIVRFLVGLRRVNVNAKDKDEQTPLISAVKKGCTYGVSLLLDTGAHWKAADFKGNPYYWAEVSLS